jgi:hypothetical protein
MIATDLTKSDSNIDKTPSDYLSVVDVNINNLPSRGLPYPPGAQISFQVMDFGTIQKFNSSELNQLSKFKFMAEGIICKGFDKKNLSYYDFVYISLLRKISTFSSTRFAIKFECEKCNHWNEQEGDLKEIEFSDLEITALPLIIDSPGGELEISPLTYEKFLVLLNDDKDTDQLSITAMCINNKTFSESVKLLSKASGEFLEDIDEAMSLINFSTQYIDRTCLEPTCGASNHIALSEVSELLEPFRTSRNSVRNRIRFGRK